MFWKLPNYSYNFKQSNSIFFHYFFCLYIVVVNFFYNTILNKNYVLYKRLNYNLYKNHVQTSFFLSKLHKIKFLANHKDFNFNFNQKQFFLFKPSYNIKTNLQKIKNRKYNQLSNADIKDYYCFFNNIVRTNNTYTDFNNKTNLYFSINSSLFPICRSYSNKKIFNINCFFSFSADTNCYTFVLKFFYISSSLHIVLYFNKSTTYLSTFNYLNKNNKLTSLFINLHYVYNNIMTFKNKYSSGEKKLKTIKNIYKYYV